MGWVRRKLNGKLVYAKAAADGTLESGARGLVDVLYSASESAKIYHANPRNLHPTGNPEDENPIEIERTSAPNGGSGNSESPTDATRARKLAEDSNSIIIYTDGACSGNPGPAGIGAVITDAGERRELSEYLGMGTNNIAELTAIERALQAIDPEHRKRAVVVHTDSSYCIGVLSKGWKAKANTELIMRIRRLLGEFSDLHFVKVKGHAGIPDNERCDELAVAAVESAR